MLLAGGLLYWRLRPYIVVARRFFSVVRDAQRMTARPESPADLRRRADGGRGQPPGAKAGEKLVRCAACGTWLPASRAVSLRASNATFCSHACLERSAGAPPRTRQSTS